jgi:hypothetical protein
MISKFRYKGLASLLTQFGGGMNILFVRLSGPVSGFALWDFPQARNAEDDPRVDDKLLRRDETKRG